MGRVFNFRTMAMQLKEQFENSDILISRQKRVLKQIKIAENFAIGFVKWCEKLGIDHCDKSIKQLLEIYKKTL